MDPASSSSTPRIACIVVSNFTLAALCRAEPTFSRTVSVDYRRAAQAALCEVATSCSPRVEDASNGNDKGYGIVYLDAQGAPFSSEYALGAALTARAESIGLEVRVGIASTKITARLAAHQSPGVTVVPPSAERRFLAPLPIALLEPDRELAAALARWGITHLGQLACLSPGAMGTRFGPAGATLVRRARGEDPTPLVPTPERSSFEEEVVLGYSIDTLEPLSFVLRGCLDRLSARLALRGLACSGLHLSLGLATGAREERTVAVAAPTTDTKVLLILTRLHLEATSPAAPIEAIRVVAVPAHMRAAQLDLFRPAGPAPEHLATTLARLATICGPGRVGAPVVVDSHRPEAIELAPFDPPTSAAAPPPYRDGLCRLALRAVRPPRAVEVFNNRGQPDFVRGDRLGGRVVELAGPWRLTGEWWTEERFARDYYDMSLSDGGVYRMYRDLKTAQWFVEGEYD
jgi:protein ImuB